MAAINFPDNPTLNQIFTSGNQTWVWDGVKWVVGGSPAAGSLYLPTTGGTLTGPLVAQGAITGQAPSTFTDLAATRWRGAGIRGMIGGLGTAYNSATSFIVAAGEAAADDVSWVMQLPAAITKTLSAWAVGTGNGALDTGAIATSSWYHVYLIQRPDTNVADILISLSATAPTMPANYTKKRRIGSICTSASQLINFLQYGDRFMWVSQLTSISGNPPNTLQRGTVSVPQGVIVEAELWVQLSGVTNSGYISMAPGIMSAVREPTLQVNGSGLVSSRVNLLTDTNATILYQCSATGTTLTVETLGWIDSRGKYN